jgi:sterol O-acyltransferase
MEALAMKEAGVPLVERFKEFPWMLSDLIFPFMMEYLVSASPPNQAPASAASSSSADHPRYLQLAWYLIWETILNILAEVTYFADRSFYDAWWNSGKYKLQLGINS